MENHVFTIVAFFVRNITKTVRFLRQRKRVETYLLRESVQSRRYFA